MTSFIGRREQLAGARDLLASSRLTTLTGPGGVGKTRLALELAAVAHRAFADGVWVVELAVVRESVSVAEAAVNALQISSSSTSGAMAQLLDYTEHREMLLVLDNCEHLLEGCQALADGLLRASPALRILATSRQPLGLNGERLVVVDPLSVPRSEEFPGVRDATRFESLALLVDRASATCPAFELTERNVRAAAQLCTRLDGIPLAIELAAARLRALSLEQLLRRIEDRFGMLTGGDPTALPRHQTLQALVDWSHDLCSPDEQRLWARMSVFAGGADLEAVESVCGGAGTGPDPGAVLDLVDRLVAKSVLIPEPFLDQVRYRMLETLADYGHQRLHAGGEEPELRARHAAHYLQLALAAADNFWQPDQGSWLTRLHTENSNLDAAFDQLTGHTPGAGTRETEPRALAMAAALRFFWVMGGALRQGRRWLDTALQAHPEPSAQRAEALWACAWVCALQGDSPAAFQRLDECDRLAAEIGAPRIAAHAATWRGTGNLFSGDLAAATESFERGLVAHRASGDVEGCLMTLFQLGITVSLTGDHTRARQLCAESLAISERHGETWARSYALWTLAHDSWSCGEHEQASIHARESVSLKLAFRDEIGTGLVVEVLAAATIALGKVEDGARMLGIATRIWRATGTGIAAFGPQLSSTNASSRRRALTELGEEAFDVLVAEGRALKPEQTRAVLLDRQPASPARATPALPDSAGLTNRERQVAALLAQGKSNRDIGSSLVLSPRTIEGHVEHILAKLGFRSRTEIAAWAAGRTLT